MQKRVVATLSRQGDRCHGGPAVLSAGFCHFGVGTMGGKARPDLRFRACSEELLGRYSEGGTPVVAPSGCCARCAGRRN